MNETKPMNESKKEKWIKAEHDKAVQIHWKNLDRIKDLDNKILNATTRIATLEKSIELIQKEIFEYEEVKKYSKKQEKIFAKCDHTQVWNHDSNARQWSESYYAGVNALRDKQKQLCFDVYKWQQEIDKHPFDVSVEIMQKDSNEEMLSKKYDRLFNKNKKVKEVNNG